MVANALDVSCTVGGGVTTQQPCWPSPSGAHEAMVIEDTSSVMGWLSPVPSGPRHGRQGERGGVTRHFNVSGRTTHATSLN